MIHIANIASLDQWLATIRNNGIGWSTNLKNIGPDVLAKKFALLTMVSFKKFYGKLYNVTKKTSNTIQKLEKNIKNIAKGTTDPGVDCFDQ